METNSAVLERFCSGTALLAQEHHMDSARKNKIKLALFRRDGWYINRLDSWRAMCGFGCGTELVWDSATIDHYPVKRRDGGRMTVKNGRLACEPCNSMDCNHKEVPPKNERRKAKAVRKQERLYEKFPDLKPYPIPDYPPEVKAKIKENYPSCEGRDRNGYRWEDF